jgi:hypothetical protein
MAFRTPLLDKTIGVRVTEADYARLQTLADAQGKPVGEWCRDVLLELAKNAAGKPRPVDHVLVAELIALRTIVANLVYSFTTGGKVTAEQMRAFVERADETKLKRAADLLAQARLAGEARPTGGPKSPKGER